MRRLYIDTATTGRMLYRESNADPRQPHLMRLAMLVVEIDDDTGERGESVFCKVIRPQRGWIVDDDAVVGHGISPTYAQAEGVALLAAYRTFVNLLPETDELIAFNLSFHQRVLARTAIDCDTSLQIPARIKPVDAMREATNIVRKPRQAPGGGYAWPKQAEAYAFFSGGLELPSIDTDPIARGLAVVRSVMVIHEGILERQTGGPA